MSLEERKVNLINWITTLNSEKLIETLERLRKEDVVLPKEILNLLNESSNSSNYTKHTSARDLL